MRATFITLIFMFGCASAVGSEPIEKPSGSGKEDAVSRLCEIADLPDDCDICEHQAWYGDGTCDDFCATADPDCAEPRGELNCVWREPVFGHTDSGELRAESEELFVVDRENADEWVDSVLDQVRAAVAVEAGIEISAENFDEVFEESDDENFTFYGVEYDEYTWVRWYMGDTEVGVIFEGETDFVVATAGDGDLRACTYE